MKHLILSKALVCASITILASLGCSNGAASSASSTNKAPQQPTTSVKVPEFRADSALAYVAAQVAFGPRVPNSEPHRRCGDWIISKLKNAGADTVIEQAAELPGTGHIRNIMGRFASEKPERILLLAHYDTRPWADEDPDESNRSRPIDGANDGASGVAVLMELANILGRNVPPCGVDILLVDAEDSGNSGDDSSWAIGTQYFVKNMPYGASEPMPSAAILLDMVGGRDAVFHRELFSQQYARKLNDEVWKAAKIAGHALRFPDEYGGAVNDDHLPLISAGIPAIDIIETNNPITGSFNPTWHTMADNLENIDSLSLKAVGETITTYIYK